MAEEHAAGSENRGTDMVTMLTRVANGKQRIPEAHTCCVASCEAADLIDARILTVSSEISWTIVSCK